MSILFLLMKLIKSRYKVFNQTAAEDFTSVFLVFSLFRCILFLWLMRKIIPLTRNWQFHNMKKNQFSKVKYSFKLTWIKSLKNSAASNRFKKAYRRVNRLWEHNISMIVFMSFLLVFLTLTLQCGMAFERL